MEIVFNNFKQIFETRYSLLSALDIGEDSVRYDFFAALNKSLQLNPWEIQLESPINKQAFIPRENPRRKSDEKPRIDLLVINSELNFCAEFALFKRNKVEGSPINETEYAFKVLNDILRLGLHSFYSCSKAYFICIADATMLKKQLWHKKTPPFPGDFYEFNYHTLKDIMGEYKSSKRIDPRFLLKLEQSNLTIRADKIFDEKVNSAINPLETRTLVWEVTNKQTNK
ncbi:MAG: hypothetical protein H0X62_14350 [Bacteroidetes bacterium]|nr:hypothetical protein [Bacteroidota bacterium]